MSNKEAREVIQSLDQALKPAYPNTTFQRDSTARNRRNEYNLRTLLKLLLVTHVYLRSIFNN